MRATQAIIARKRPPTAETSSQTHPNPLGFAKLRSHIVFIALSSYGAIPVTASSSTATAVKSTAEVRREFLDYFAGKGHEDYQILEGQRMPFSDAAQARDALQRRAAT